jgi:uncharacterized protein YidB (DUF937 family)
MSGLDDILGGASGGGLGDLIGSLAGGTTSGGGLDDILGKLTGGAGTDDTGAPGGLGGMLTALVPMVGGMLAGGGLGDVLARLDANGLSAQTASWIGRGANEPIGAADVEQALGHDRVAELADRLGISDEDAAGAVAQALPAIVDDLTPEGQLPSEDEIDEALRRILGG